MNIDHIVLWVSDQKPVNEDPMNQLLGHSITYRIAVGPSQGRKVFTLRTLPERDPYESSTSTVGKVSGFSLHAGVAAKAQQRDKLERLCRYITRPAVSEKRLSLTTQGKVRYELKTSYRDGTTHVIFEPLDFIARLAALVPKPRVNLTRFHGVFAPNSKHRVQVTPARRGKRSKPKAPEQAQDRTPRERRAAMSFKPSVSSGCSGSRLRSASTVAGRYYRYFGKADVQMPVFTFTEGPQVADSGRSGGLNGPPGIEGPRSTQLGPS
jgi:hypothetical protein